MSNINNNELLKYRVMDFLQTLEPNCFFWRVKDSSKVDITGCSNGQSIYIKIMVKGKLKKDELLFSAKTIRSGAKYYVVRSLDDICELAKLGGWHD